MKRFFFLLVSITATVLSGCANQPLVRSYSGEVNVRTLQVELAPIRDPEQNLSEDYSKLTKILKGAQEVMDLFEPKHRDRLITQLHTFETTLVEGIRDRAGIPLKAAQNSEVSMQYGDENELVSIEYDYPLVEGAYVNLFATVYYTERSDLALGAAEYNANFIELVPEIILQIDGYNENGDLFWRHTARYESKQAYKFGDQYVLGVPTKRLDEAQIFLVPMAKGVIEELASVE
ncbi:hypothetical protein [Marinobacterium jannaschii]|uniref:hypothetical protein n=1 Tax=Marinobacterium jannaschii TaxID=64970 RepID=UPI0004873399|nr:hypothetical protein [Marinobacterium jannaschii]